MKLNQLKALVAVADAGSIHEAARALNLTQSALSKSVKELEREVGAELLVRSARGTTLTPCGHTVIRRSRSIDREIGKMREEIDIFRGTQGCRLTIGHTPPAGTAPLAEALAAFLQKRPAVELTVLELRGAQIAEGLRNGTLDLGIVSTYQEPSAEFQSRHVLSHNTVLLAGRRDRETSLAALKDATWLTFDPVDDPDGCISTLFDKFSLPPPRKIVRCSSTMLYMQLAMRVGAVMHLMEGALESLEDYLAQGTMTHLVLPHEMPPMNIHLQFPDEDLLTSSAREFVDLYERSCRRFAGRSVAPRALTITC